MRNRLARAMAIGGSLGIPAGRRPAIESIANLACHHRRRIGVCGRRGCRAAIDASSRANLASQSHIVRYAMLRSMKVRLLPP
jgi:hypothetical protein